MKLTPKEKAKELLKRFESVSKPFMKESEVQVHIHPEHAKQCAFICLDEMENILMNGEDLIFENASKVMYLEEVKQELEKL